MSIRIANNARVLQMGNTIADRTKNNLIIKINHDFTLNPSYREVYINGSAIKIGVIITDNSSNAFQKVDYIRKIIMKPNDILHVGDIIEWNNLKWICTSAEQFSDIYYKGTIQQTNNILKFYNKTTLSLVEVPCIFSDISIDMQQGKFMNLPIGHYNVLISSGYITKEDLNLRFLLNDSAYKIEGISNATNGLTKIELVDDEFIPDDNRILGICNYFSNQIVREVIILNGETSTLLYTNATLQLNVECKENGVIVSNPVVTYESNNTYVCTVDINGLITAHGTGDAVVSVRFENVSDTIAIRSDITITNNYNIVLTPSDATIKASRSLAITAMVTNNGINDPIKQIGFIVSNVDSTNNQYVTYIVDGNNITISAGATYSKFINIKAYMLAYPDIFVNMQIKIVSLI